MVMRNVYRILFGESQRKKPHDKPRRRGEDNIKMRLGGIEREVVKWMQVRGRYSAWLL
jgi:hypothetical protein